MKTKFRESRNGYETTFSLHYLTTTHYVWELIRYPLDIHNQEPTEAVLVFEGRFKWADAIAEAEKYLNEHPDDGYCEDSIMLDIVSRTA